MPDLVEIAGYLGAGGLGAAALKLVDTVVSKRRTPEQKLGDAADAAGHLIELALEASGSSVKQLMGELRALRAKVDNLERSHAECEARCESLTQDNRQMAQKLDSLLRQLRDPASTQPGGALSGAVIELADGDVTVIPPASQRRTGQ